MTRVMTRAYLLALLEVAWRLAAIALPGAVIPGLTFHSWTAAVAGWTAMFALGVTVVAAKNQIDRWLNNRDDACGRDGFLPVYTPGRDADQQEWGAP
jgi:hypothetical protein